MACNSSAKKRPAVGRLFGRIGRLGPAGAGLFLLPVLVFFMTTASFPVLGQDWDEIPPAADQSAEAGEDELIDFFIEAVEGVEEPQTAPMPSLPPSVTPLPTSKAPAAAPPPAPPAAVAPPASVQIEDPAPAPGWTPLPAAEAPVEAGPLSPPPPADQPAPYGSFAPAASAPFNPNDPFNPPGAAAPPALEAGPGPSAAPAGVPLGQGAVSPPPAPFWGDSAGGAVGDGWIQLEVGQSDLVTPPAPESRGRPASIYSLPEPASAAARPVSGPQLAEDARRAESSLVDRAMDQAIQEPAATGPVLKDDERENLKRLFSDILPPDPQPTAQAEPPAVPETDRPAASAVGSASAILQAGAMLSGSAAATPAPAAPAPPAAAPAPVPAPAAVAEVEAQKPPEVLPASAEKPVEGSAAQAQVQPESAAKPVKTAAVQPKPKAKAKAKKKAAKSGGQARASSAPARASVSLIIINETGRDSLAGQYASVLGRLGYQVASAVDGPAGKGGGGGTVVSYRSGYRSQAQAVARSLPGRKTLVEAAPGQVLASEILIQIR